MTVESTTQALCDLALRFGEGDEESMVRIFLLNVVNLFNLCFDGAICFIRFFLDITFYVSYVYVQSRPFGVSLLIAGHDENGPCL